jgi:hypothetical protein
MRLEHDDICLELNAMLEQERTKVAELEAKLEELDELYCISVVLETCVKHYCGARPIPQEDRPN